MKLGTEKKVYMEGKEKEEYVSNIREWSINERNKKGKKKEENVSNIRETKEITDTRKGERQDWRVQDM